MIAPIFPENMLMKNTTLYLIVTILIYVAGNHSNAQVIDTENSTVNFEISNMRFNTVKGEIKGMKGEVRFDEDDLENSQFDVCVNPATIDTGNDSRDKHLRNEDFFNVERYPTICFVSSSIIKAKNGYIANGRLTLYGTGQTIAIPFEKLMEGNSIALIGEIEVNRFDYGLAAESYDGTFMVGKTAKLKIVCKLK